ncbi:Acetoin utilization deacetylase AcuC [Moraxella cuniculi DSM 21768]|uniref:Acetoin utilization deacetylase AcuC n=1 Tax=Moraxella cuniculi DSM 21768 TaxID=1122245 RepID=A0A1N7DD46_9GAMM|nr:histone deacetylase [Moraxella cuniculi]OOS07988.1 histone deacetylase [Moraxella cuniculi]SIR73763.1 Acetoin utilization deacetylase AcuC [Moraxella cuniculi DSM 21768]
MLKIAHSPLFCHPLPANHRFPMAKYQQIPERLISQGVICHDNLFHPILASEAEILSTHTAKYWHELKTLTLAAKDARKIGLPMSAELIKRERYIAHGTYECALYAKNYGISLSTSGGTHHAFAGHGEGFCILNDICIASNLLIHRKQAERILIIDLDVHQGNGNAAIMADNPKVFVFSMHGKKNYPFIKPPSDLDIELDDGTDDTTYLHQLSHTLPTIIDSFCPDMIFYQAGVDVLATDALGKLSLSMAGCERRDEIVLRTAHQHGIPVVVVMGGGYSPNLGDIITAHCQTFLLAKQIWQY